MFFFPIYFFFVLFVLKVTSYISQEVFVPDRCRGYSYHRRVTMHTINYIKYISSGDSFCTQRSPRYGGYE